MKLTSFRFYRIKSSVFLPTCASNLDYCCCCWSDWKRRRVPATGRLTCRSFFSCDSSPRPRPALVASSTYDQILQLKLNTIRFSFHRCRTCRFQSNVKYKIQSTGPTRKPVTWFQDYISKQLCSLYYYKQLLRSIESLKELTYKILGTAILNKKIRFLD